MSFLFLVIGFVLLVKGADILINSASKLAAFFGVSPFIIGLSVVAFGTSAPEATVGVLSGIDHTNQLSLGDVVGSCIANIALIIGVTVIIKPLVVERSTIKKELPLSLGMQILLLVMALLGSIISRIDGIVLLVLFASFLCYVVYSSRQDPENQIVDGMHIALDEIAVTSDSIDASAELGTGNASILGSSTSQKSNIKEIGKLIFLLVLGLTGLVGGGNIVVDSSVNIAHMFGLNETLIGLTIVAIGTSLPELVTSVMAALKNESDIAIGNIIGSNIFNILFVLGLSSTIFPIKVLYSVNLDILIMILTTVLLFALAFFQKKISRIGGFVLLSYYIGYIIFKVSTI